MKANDTVRLPPIIKNVDVTCSPERAFEIFTTEVHAWWPLDTHSLGSADHDTVAFEPYVGGRIIERDKTGKEHVWGTVLEWSPRSKLRFTWRVGHAAESKQEVEVRFESSKKGGTRVTLSHSGWENPEYRANYDADWDLVIGKYVSRASV